MLRNDAIRMQHMLDAAQEACGFAQGLVFDDLEKDRKLVLALVKDIEIIGEAAYQVSDTVRAQIPGIPWDDVMGMRHRLVHAYFDINLEILWKTVKDDLPSLIVFLENEHLDRSVWI